MKTAHVKTVDGKITMIPEEYSERLRNWLKISKVNEVPFRWKEDKEEVFLFKCHIISVRFREVE